MSRNTFRPQLSVQKLSGSVLCSATMATNSENERASECCMRLGQCTFINPSRGYVVRFLKNTTVSAKAGRNSRVSWGETRHERDLRCSLHGFLLMLGESAKPSSLILMAMRSLIEYA